MRIPPGTGLAGAGAVCQSFLARMPAFVEHLGPVIGLSFRVSQRIVNTLKHGVAGRDYSVFASCRSIWLMGADRWLEWSARELAAADVLRGKIVVICDSWHDSSRPGILRDCGAKVATLNRVPETGERLFVCEGHADARRAIRNVLAAERRRVIEIEAAAKPLYFAGLQFSSQLVLPWIAAGLESLRAAGFSRREATELAIASGTRAVKNYAKAGPKAWSMAKAREMHAAVKRGADEFRRRDPKLADLYEAGAHHARSFFEPDWRPEVRAVAKPSQREQPRLAVSAGSGERR